MSSVDRLRACEILINKWIHQLVAQSVEQRGCAKLWHEVGGTATLKCIDKAVDGYCSIRRVRNADAESGVSRGYKIDMKAPNVNLVLTCATTSRAINVHEPFRLAYRRRTASTKGRRQ